MEILITIKEKKVKIKLLDGKKEVDSLEIVEDHSLSKQLLPEIDTLLKRNGLEVREVENVRVSSDQDESFTTTRIARTVAETWNFACG